MSSISTWIPVKFNKEDCDKITNLSIKRNSYDIERGLVSKTTNNNNKWNISGMAGEAAVSRHLKLSIDPFREDVDYFSKADVGDNIDVKSSTRIDICNLVVNCDQLKPDRIYVMTNTFSFPDTVFLMGFALGKEIARLARKSKHRDNGHDIYIYDKRWLMNMNDINCFSARL